MKIPDVSIVLKWSGKELNVTANVYVLVCEICCLRCQDLTLHLLLNCQEYHGCSWLGHAMFSQKHCWCSTLSQGWCCSPGFSFSRVHFKMSPGILQVTINWRNSGFQCVPGQRGSTALHVMAHFQGKRNPIFWINSLVNVLLSRLFLPTYDWWKSCCYQLFPWDVWTFNQYSSLSFTWAP